MNKRLGIDVNSTHTTAQHELGAIVDDIKGGEGASSLSFKEYIDASTTTRYWFPDAQYQYVKAGSAISAGNAVKVDVTASNEPYTVVPTSAVNDIVAGICPVAIASGSYGFMQIRGRVRALTNTGTLAAGDKLVAGSTAGKLGALVSNSNITTSTNLLAFVGFAAGKPVVALNSNDSNAADIEVMIG